MFDYSRGIDGSFWRYTAPAGGVTDTANYQLVASTLYSRILTSMEIQNVSTTATELEIRRGATVLARYYLPASMPAPVPIIFDPPLSSNGGENLNYQCTVTGSKTYVNARGSVAPSIVT